MKGHFPSRIHILKHLSEAFLGKWNYFSEFFFFFFSRISHYLCWLHYFIFVCLFSLLCGCDLLQSLPDSVAWQLCAQLTPIRDFWLTALQPCILSDRLGPSPPPIPLSCSQLVQTLSPSPPQRLPQSLVRLLSIISATCWQQKISKTLKICGWRSSSAFEV